MRRVVWAVVLTAWLAFGVVAAAHAADQIGGTLSASSTGATFTNDGTVLTHAVFQADGVTRLDPPMGDVAPGANLVTHFADGAPVGPILVHLTSLAAAQGDSASVTLKVNVAPHPAPFPWGTIAIGVVCLVAFLATLRRVRPWRWRIVRT